MLGFFPNSDDCSPRRRLTAINGRKKFMTCAAGTKIGIIMANLVNGACVFPVICPIWRTTPFGGE